MIVVRRSEAPSMPAGDENESADAVAGGRRGHALANGLSSVTVRRWDVSERHCHDDAFDLSKLIQTSATREYVYLRICKRRIWFLKKRCSRSRRPASRPAGEECLRPTTSQYVTSRSPCARVRAERIKSGSAARGRTCTARAPANYQC